MLDNNLSSRLVGRLADVFPNALHVRHVGLEDKDDEAIWAHAAANGFAIVTRDADFNDLVETLGRMRTPGSS